MHNHKKGFRVTNIEFVEFDNGSDSGDRGK